MHSHQTQVGGLALDDHPTTENLAKFIFEKVQALGYAVTEVTLWETPTSYATYSG